MMTSASLPAAVAFMPYPRELVTTKRPPPPLDPVYKSGAIESLRHWVFKARQIFKCDIPMPSVSFDLLGRVGGYANSRTNHIRLNPVLLAENPGQYFNGTIPHELAHLITQLLHPGKIKPHGVQWQAVMRRLGLAPKRTHSMDTTQAATCTQRYISGFSCGCGARTLSIRKHNSYVRGTTYTCRVCDQIIVGDEALEAARAAYVPPTPKRRARRRAR